MSETIVEPARATPVIHKTDVLVVGSGPGGLAAALAAALSGVEVTLLDRFGCFGGNITVVGVEGFAWYRHEQTIEADLRCEARFEDSVGLHPEFIGGDRIAHAATRNMAFCAIAGQSAGLAAAMSLHRNTSLRSIDLTTVQKQLV